VNLRGEMGQKLLKLLVLEPGFLITGVIIAVIRGVREWMEALTREAGRGSDLWMRSDINSRGKFKPIEWAGELGKERWLGYEGLLVNTVNLQKSVQYKWQTVKREVMLVSYRDLV